MGEILLILICLIVGFVAGWCATCLVINSVLQSYRGEWSEKLKAISRHARAMRAERDELKARVECTQSGRGE